MSLILGIETGTDLCSVALSRDDELIALRESGPGRDHAQKLSVFIDELLRENELSPDDLDAVAVSMGPGSYTGLRIGVSTAKGLCYALDIPLIGIGSLTSLAYVAAEDFEAGILEISDWNNVLLCPMIDARRMEVYAQVFDSDIKPISEIDAHIIEADSFERFIESDKEFVIFGDGAKKCVEILPEGKVTYLEVVPSARGLVKPAWEAFQTERFENIAYFEPLYLKDFVVTKSKKKLL